MYDFGGNKASGRHDERNEPAVKGQGGGTKYSASMMGKKNIEHGGHGVFGENHETGRKNDEVMAKDVDITKSKPDFTRKKDQMVESSVGLIHRKVDIYSEENDKNQLMNEPTEEHNLHDIIYDRVTEKTADTEKLDLSEATVSVGPGVSGDTKTVIDGNTDRNSWLSAPNGAFNTCNEAGYVTIDLKKNHFITGVTLYHYYGDGRKYCHQAVQLSQNEAGLTTTPVTVYDTGIGYGDIETDEGKTLVFPPTEARYVRHFCGRSTANSGVHFIEIELYALKKNKNEISGVGGDNIKLMYEDGNVEINPKNNNLIEEEKIHDVIGKRGHIETSMKKVSMENIEKKGHVDAETATSKILEEVTLEAEDPKKQIRQNQNENIHVGAKNYDVWNKTSTFYGMAKGNIDDNINYKSKSGETCKVNIDCGQGYTCDSFTKKCHPRFANEACSSNSDCLGTCLNNLCLSTLKFKLRDAEVSSTSFQSYGTDQDGGGGVTLANNGFSVAMHGNAWKAFQLPQSYVVTKFTKLAFTFSLTHKAEGHAICLDEDLNEETFTGIQKRCIALAGTQYGEWDEVIKEGGSNGQEEEITISYEVSVSELFNYQKSTVKYLGFIQDNDDEPSIGLSEFGKIELFEELPSNINTLITKWEEVIKDNVEISSQEVAYSVDGIWKVQEERYFSSNGLSNRGRVRIYKKDSNLDYVLQKQLVGINSGDKLGSSVSLPGSGNILAVGAPFRNSGSGSVYLYHRNGDSWAQKKELKGENANDDFGCSVSLSNSGNILAVGAQTRNSNGWKTGSVFLYHHDGDSWALKNEFKGRNTNDLFGNSVSLSNSGNILAIAAPYRDSNGEDSGSVYIHHNDGNNVWREVKEFKGQNKEVSLGIGGVAVMNDGELLVHARDYYGKIHSYWYNCQCMDTNAKCVNFRNPKCQCNDGFLSSGSKGGEILNSIYETCVPSVLADIQVMHDMFTLHIETTIGTDERELTRQGEDNEIIIKLTQRKFDADEVNKFYTFKDLQPGILYNATLGKVSVPAVTHCSCSTNSPDVTGRPTNFSITQDNGYILFNFTDNSYCEEAYSFTRSLVAEEFLSDVSQYGTSFTSDYYFYAKKPCTTIVEPGIQSSDDLRISRLVVGNMYTYCVRAVASHYMDHPYDVSEKRRTLTSSDDMCTKHKVKWEASIHGKVTTEPNAGSLPIKDVTVTWELLDLDYSNSAIALDSFITGKGGTFVITFNVDNTQLNNEEEFPVRVKFSKTSKSGDEPIAHKFLCNEGEDDCTEEGIIVYLKHLQFSEPLHVFDDTTVPFRGKVFVHDTVYPGMDGCIIPNAKVCLYQKGTHGIEIELVCGTTQSDGTFDLPAVIGSIVHSVNISYHGHFFAPTDKNEWDYEHGITMKEDGFYTNNDFADMTKARLLVDVVGGLCEKRLGVSSIAVKMTGCSWEGKLFTQSGTRGEYQVPAHIMNIQIVDVADNENESMIKIVDHFQQITRTIDLLDTQSTDEAFTQIEAEESEKESQKITGTEDASNIEQQNNNIAALEEEEEEDLELVRFQYDGDLKIYITVLSKDKLSQNCSDKVVLDEDGYNADSLHVIEYMTLFEVRVDLKYEIIKNEVFCDIMAGDLQIYIKNEVGVDENAGFEEFLAQTDDKETRDALQYCSKGCLQNVTHDVNKEGKNVGRAGVDTSFATGRPNISPDTQFVKNIYFQVQDVVGVEHKAAIFVEGLYSKGPGKSFALPSHEPVMILRDPPGGLSYATYENVMTTVKIVSSETSTHISSTFGLGVKTAIKADDDLCSGGGLGAIVLYCKKPASFDEAINIVDISQDIGGQAQLDNFADSNEFTTTWSFETSSDPWLAGSMSDVFVVPNINVIYMDATEVLWDKETCSGSTSDKVVFDLKAPTTQPAIAFYSRYHVKYVKILELQRSHDNVKQKIDDIKNGKDVCDCKDSEEKCPCDDKAKQEEEEKLHTLVEGIEGWEKALTIGEDTSASQTSIVDWFDTYGNSDLTGDHSSALIPPVLSTSAVELENNLMENTDQDTDTSPKNIKRIQFSGGGNTFELKMKKERVDEHLENGCWKGCSVDSTTNFKGPSLDKSNKKVFGFGVDLSFNLLDITVAVSHTSSEGTQNTKSTEVSFVLGDDNVADEFVVDMFVDKRYESIIFKTVAGQSSCPHEANTAKIEDPAISISKLPSPVVMPDKEIVFELNLANFGVGPRSAFMLYPDLRDNEGGLTFMLDGDYFSDNRQYDWIDPGQTVTSTLTVSKGARLFRNKAITLYLRSACETDGNVGDANLKIGGTEATITLSNVHNDQGSFLEFVEPCPKVEWAGELKHDRSFLVNTESDSTEYIKITVLNPDYTNRKFEDHLKERLEHVYLKYRRVGDVAWNNALINVVTDETTGKTEIKDLDFALYGDESEYGYISLNWLLGGKVPEGTYEIMVETKCNKLGGPEDFDMFSTLPLTGVIDTTRPKQYGSSLPLRDMIMIGEEIIIVFTEPLQCGLPLSFDIEISVEDTEIEFDKDDLHVICEGRKIGLQLDLTFLTKEVQQELMGKRFSVEIGKIGNDSMSKVMDHNGNAMNPLKGNIKFEKMFANLNLNEASTSFTFTLDDMTCSDSIVASLENDVKSKIAADLNLPSTDRIQLRDVNCLDNENKVSAVVTILPASNRLRRVLFSEEEDYSVNLFYTLRDTSDEIKRGVRKLSSGEGSSDSSFFSVSQMKIMPGPSDAEILKTDPMLALEEEELRRVASLVSTAGDADLLLLQEMRTEHKVEVVMGKMRKHGDEQMEGMRKQMMEGMRKQIEVIRKNQDEQLGVMRKHEDSLLEEIRILHAKEKEEREKRVALEKEERERRDALEKEEHERRNALEKEERERRNALEKEEHLLLRALQEKQRNEQLRSLRTEVIFVMAAGMSITIAVFLHLIR